MILNYCLNNSHLLLPHGVSVVRRRQRSCLFMRGLQCPRCRACLVCAALRARCRYRMAALWRLLSHPPRYDSTTAVFAYAFPVDALIQRFKYGGSLAIAPLLSGVLGSAVAEPADLIIPIAAVAATCTRTRLQPGARNRPRVGRMTGIPVVAGVLPQNRETRPQPRCVEGTHQKHTRRVRLRC